MITLVNQRTGHDKYYVITTETKIDKCLIIVHYGKISTSGQWVTYTCKDQATALGVMVRKIKEKKAKGYRELNDTESRHYHDYLIK